MPKFRKEVFLALSLLLSSSLSFFPSQTKAQSTSTCIGTMSPHTVPPNRTKTLSIQVDNTSSFIFHWIKLSRSDTNYTILSASAAGWSASLTSDDIILSGSTLAVGNSMTILVQVQTGAVDYIAYWPLSVSGNSDGTGAAFCDGDLSLQIDAGQPPSITNISLSNLTSTSVQITWTTDSQSSSKVNYGVSDSYGLSTPTDNSLVTSHLVNLTGLTANTYYHFQVESTDENGNTADSIDNTFLTAVEAAFSGKPTGEPASSPAAKVKLNPTEKVPPEIKVLSDLTKPFSKAPAITGLATDNVGIFSVEYSLDGGRDWLAVDKVDGLGSKSASFVFTPVNLDDGNYSLLARATDTSGNQALSEKKTLIIDRLPPIVGGSVISVGSQVLEPDQNGRILAMTGSDEKISLAAVGGPISIQIRAKANQEEKVFALSQSKDTGLWRGLMSFDKSGLYQLSVEALDGAGNRTKRQLNQVFVASSGQVLDKKTNKPLSGSSVVLHYFEPEAAVWEVWDGEAFEQANPVQTRKDGQFSFLAPVGKYYLEVKDANYHRLVSNIFQQDQLGFISADLSLTSNLKVNLGPLKFQISSLFPDSEKIALKQIGLASSSTKEETLTSFNLPDENGQTHNSFEFLAKPTLFAFVATWSDSSAAELDSLGQLQQNPDINVVVIDTLESAGKLASYKSISHRELNFLIDHDGVTVDKFSYSSLPANYFISRRGVIKKVVVGVLSKGEILDYLGGL